MLVCISLISCSTDDIPQDEQKMTQSPQIQTEELADNRDLLYEAFLKNETSVTNPYVEGMNLTVMDDKEYESEFEDAQKKYAYVDVKTNLRMKVRPEIKYTFMMNCPVYYPSDSNHSAGFRIGGETSLYFSNVDMLFSFP